MHIQYIITNTAILVVMLAVGCSKNQSEPTAQGQNVRQVSSLPADMPKKDLGEVELSASILKRVSLDAGKECVITPTVLADGSLQMDLAVETKTADGKIQRLGKSRITSRPGQQSGVTVGGMMVSLTPKLKTP